MTKMGIAGNVLDWFKNYLENRKQIVKIGDVRSEELSIHTGVPQGSKLGPLLFVLYVNFLPRIMKHCQVHLFADDTLIYISGDDPTEMVNTLNQELKELTLWLKKNVLVLNAKKTKYMTISKDGKATALNVTIDGEPLEMVQEIVYLGVTLDAKLNMAKHFKSSISRFKQKLSVLRRFKYSLPRYVKILLYNSLIKPQLLYCSTLWFSATQEMFREVQVLINRAMRNILKCDKEKPIKEMLQELQWCTFSDSIFMDTMTLVFKIEKKLTPSYLNVSQIAEDLHDHNTRNKSNMVRSINRTRVKSIYAEGIAEYYCLNKEIRGAQSIQIFKTRLEKHLLSSSEK